MGAHSEVSSQAEVGGSRRLLLSLSQHSAYAHRVVSVASIAIPIDMPSARSGEAGVCLACSAVFSLSLKSRVSGTVLLGSALLKLDPRSCVLLNVSHRVEEGLRSGHQPASFEGSSAVHERLGRNVADGVHGNTRSFSQRAMLSGVIDVMRFSSGDARDLCGVSSGVAGRARGDTDSPAYDSRSRRDRALSQRAVVLVVDERLKAP
jgi:hypothetical protein